MNAIVLTAAQTQEKSTQADWGSLTWLASKELENAEGLTLGRVIIKKGHSNPRHSHPNCEEVLYLLSGTLEHTMGGESVVLNPGDTISIDAGIPHNAVNIGDKDADMIVVYSSAERGFQKE